MCILYIYISYISLFWTCLPVQTIRSLSGPIVARTMGPWHRAQASSVVNSRRLETGRRLQTSLLWSASWDVFVYEQQMSAAAGRSVPILEGGNIKDGEWCFSCFFPPGSAELLDSWRLFAWLRQRQSSRICETMPRLWRALLQHCWWSVLTKAFHSFPLAPPENWGLGG